MRRADPLIVGGGPAGAAAAIYLARAGSRPLIVERQPEGRDALCGGFLSWRTLERLERLGIARALLGGQEVRFLRLFIGGKPHEFALPGLSMGVSRARLDGLLLERALQEGAALRHETAREYADGVLRLDSGEHMAAASLFLATGKHDLRGLTRPSDAVGADPMLGLRLRLPAAKHPEDQLAGAIEMHLFDGGYLGMVLQEDGSANACMAVRKSRLAHTGSPAALFRALADSSPALAHRLADIPVACDIDAVAHIPYGWRARTTQAGVFRLGDQAGVIASLAGEGIGIALASAEEAVLFWRNGGASAATAYQRAFSRRLRRPLLAGEMMSRLAYHPESLRLLMRPRAVSFLAQIARMG